MNSKAFNTDGAALGATLQVSPAYLSAAGTDALADWKLSASAGHWKGGYTPATQADWAADFAGLAIGKPFVKSVYRGQLNDAEAINSPTRACSIAPGNRSRRWSGCGGCEKSICGDRWRRFFAGRYAGVIGLCLACLVSYSLMSRRNSPIIIA